MNKKRKKPTSDGDLADMSNDELRAELGLEDDPTYTGNMSSEEVASVFREIEHATLQDSWEDFDDLMLQLPHYLQSLQDSLNSSFHHKNPPMNFAKGDDELYESSEAFSMQTVSRIEDFFLGVLDGTESFSGELNELKLYLGLYLGEAIAENLEGEWMICEDETSADYGKPVVALWNEDSYGPSLNPFEIVEILSKTRQKDILIGTINGMKQGAEGY